MNAPPTNWQQRLAFCGATLFFVGGLTGILVANAMETEQFARADILLSSHLNALLGCFWLLGLGWTLQWMRFSERNFSLVCTLSIVAAWANWLFTLIKAYLDVHGIAYTSDANNNAIFLALTLTVVLPTLGASFLWALGLWKGCKACP